jgi:hypothetical protein
VPLTHLIVRTPDQNAVPRPTPLATIDHFALTVADFQPRRSADRTHRTRGQECARRRAPSLHMDDVFGYDVQICGLENALTDG